MASACRSVLSKPTSIPPRRNPPLLASKKNQNRCVRFRTVRCAMQLDLKEVATAETVKEEPKLSFSGRLDAVSEADLREKGFLGLRKTKLVCTVGPACAQPEELEVLASRGMNVARLNMCHNTREWHREVIRNVKSLNEEKGFNVALMIDTEGSQIHVIDHGGSSSVKAEDGSAWLFTTEKYKGFRPLVVQVNYDGFSEGIVVGDELVVEGGMASFKVTEKIGKDLRCTCIDPGLLLPRAKLSVWRDGKLLDSNPGLPTLSTKVNYSCQISICLILIGA